eukprot:gene511-3837_t
MESKYWQSTTDKIGRTGRNIGSTRLQFDHLPVFSMTNLDLTVLDPQKT